MKLTPIELDRITDVVLAYKLKDKVKARAELLAICRAAGISVAPEGA